MPILGSRGAAALRSWGFGGVGVPAAPIIGTATRQTNGTINVQFTLGYNGGLPITSVTARSSPGNITATTTNPAGGLINVSGLTLGTTYTFVVFATNAIGNSADSTASNSQRAATAPSAPTIGTATIASPTSVSVSYTAPANNGEPITSYTATSSPGGITGTVNTAGSGSITVSGLTSGTAYTFTVTATNAVGTGPASSASNQVTPQVPTYTISGPTSINEGSSGNFNVVTNETVAATTIYWDISGTGVTAADLGLTQLNGSLSISTNSTATLTLSPAADLTTEGNESFTLTFYTNSGRTTILTGAAISGTVTGNQRTVTINDTSTTPAPTYSISSNQSSVNEGSTASFSVTTTNFGSGTLYWDVQTMSGTVNSNDLTTSGSVSISSNSGTISISIASDLTTEGSESFRIRLYTDSGRSNLVATSTTVTINDTSLTPPQLNATASLNFNYVIAGLPSQTKAYYLFISRDGSGPSTQSWSVNSGGLSIQSGIGTGSSSGTFTAPSIVNAVVGFTGPHSSATVTVTVSASGYTSYVQSFSVSANSLYTPYNFSRGFPQEFSSSSATARSYSQTIANTVYESISTPFTTDSIGGRTTWYGLGRRADAGGANFWGGYCESNGISPSSLAFYNAFFGSVNSAGAGNEDYQAAITNSKSFRLGTGYDKFSDRP